MLASAPVAIADDTFVNQATGNNANNCLTPASACQTISGASGGVQKAGAGDTVFVADPATQTTYVENVFLNGGKSLVALSPDPTETIIDNGTGMGTTPAVFVLGAAGGTVEGFTIRSDYQALLAQSPVTVRGNIFNEGTQPTNTLTVDVQLDISADGSLVTENTFVDPNPTAGQNQVGVFTASSTVSDNSFQDLTSAIFAGGSMTATQTITGNQITGVRLGSNAGAGIVVTHGNPTIIDNRIDSFFYAMPNDSTNGIVLNSSGADLVGATLRRNVVIGARFGIFVEDTAGPVTLEGDLIVQSRINGLRLNDTAVDEVNVADASATNITIADTDDPTVAFEAEVTSINANLTLDSSIIDDKGIDDQGSSICSISFSRNVMDGTGDPSCDVFQTNANPMFIDYHLPAGSPLIDGGNPAPPSATVDIDGQPRAVLGQPSCTLTAGRRDIGADEFQPATGVGCPLPPTTPTPTAAPLKKKCKKGRKLKKGKCVKRKRKKR